MNAARNLTTFVVAALAGGCERDPTEPADRAAEICPAADARAALLAAAAVDQPGWTDRRANLGVCTDPGRVGSVCGPESERCEIYLVDGDCEVARLQQGASDLDLLPDDVSLLAIDQVYPRPGGGGLTWAPDRGQDDTMQIDLGGADAYTQAHALLQLEHGEIATGLASTQLGGLVEPLALPHENHPWSWRIAPDSVELMKEIEVCDSWPRYVEDNLERWLEQPTPYLCPWGLGMVAARVSYPGGDPLVVPPHYQAIRATIVEYYDAMLAGHPAPVGGGTEAPFPADLLACPSQ